MASIFGVRDTGSICHHLVSSGDTDFLFFYYILPVFSGKAFYCTHSVVILLLILIQAWDVPLKNWGLKYRYLGYYNNHKRYGAIYMHVNVTKKVCDKSITSHDCGMAL